MQLKPLIAKALRGETLNALEIAELEQFDPDSVRSELDETRSRLEAAENAKLSREERLQKELDSVRAAHAALEGEHRTFRRKQRIEQLAAASGCDDSAYLDFRAAQAGVDLDDERAAAALVAEVAKSSPARFRARIVPGSSAGTPAAGNAAVPPADDDWRGQDRIARIAGSLDGAPDAL